MSAAVSSLEIPPPALHRTGDLVLPHTLRTRDVIRAVWHAIARRWSERRRRPRSLDRPHPHPMPGLAPQR
ncbi:hypothetical protein [Actinomyces oricola]|uniref:hypothetical protein n=1 Tax=Actinomyces oricola TaxID=206043 RepID=UPI000FFF5D7E|nr:hypothetical protein [Actinomyces oricola]